MPHLYDETTSTPPAQLFLAEEGGEILGVCCLRPSRAGRGSHVANAAYLVAQACRGRGVGRQLAEFSLCEAAAQRFRAMQFGFVVATNPAVALWKRLGFQVVGRRPDNFFVDTIVMHRPLP